MPLAWMPYLVRPLTGDPALVTWLPSIVRFDELLISMPWPEVPVTVNPCTVTQLRPESAKPCAAPVIVTSAFGAAVKVIGLVAVPELTTVTCSAIGPGGDLHGRARGRALRAGADGAERRRRGAGPAVGAVGVVAVDEAHEPGRVHRLGERRARARGEVVGAGVDGGDRVGADREGRRGERRLTAGQRGGAEGRGPVLEGHGAGRRAGPRGHGRGEGDRPAERRRVRARRDGRGGRGARQLVGVELRVVGTHVEDTVGDRGRGPDRSADRRAPQRRAGPGGAARGPVGGERRERSVVGADVHDVARDRGRGRDGRAQGRGPQRCARARAAVRGPGRVVRGERARAPIRRTPGRSRPRART